MGDGSGEASMVRTYLEWLTELPWKADDAKTIDIAEARRVLDEDHYGLDKIKRRILEYLAVRKLNPEGKSPILCFVGPPGVGKTSLGQSIAKATGREFQRVALGGVHDEAEIRGHRRTYIGALPGQHHPGVETCRHRATGVLMLDEVDKLGAGGFHGDPSSALLEVLDPEQNSKFRDNYLGVRLRLVEGACSSPPRTSSTPFPGRCAIAWRSSSCPATPRRRSWRSRARYLVKRQLEANGLNAGAGRRSPMPRCAAIIADYTREAGVRNLEREIGAVLRRVAMRIAEGEAQARSRSMRATCTPILGAARFENEVAQRAGDARRRDRAGLDAGGRGHPVHRERQGAGLRQADPHGPARRRDEGVARRRH